MPRLLLIGAVLLIAHLGFAQNSGTINVAKPEEVRKGITATVAGKSGGAITKSQLLSAKVLWVNDTTQVISYIFSMNRASIKTSIEVQGNLIGPDIKKHLEELRGGQICRFREILCRDKNGLTYRVSDVQFTIWNRG